MESVRYDNRHLWLLNQPHHRSIQSDRKNGPMRSAPDRAEGNRILPFSDGDRAGTAVRFDPDRAGTGGKGVAPEPIEELPQRITTKQMLLRCAGVEPEQTGAPDVVDQRIGLDRIVGTGGEYQRSKKQDER